MNIIHVIDHLNTYTVTVSADLVMLRKFKDVIVIVFFHFYVLIRPEILLSGTRSTMGVATYTNY